MEAKTRQLLDQIVIDKKALQKKMAWDVSPSTMAILSAFLFACEGRKADVDRYVECRKYLKQNVGAFSELRGIAKAIVVTKMCLAGNYEEYLAGLLEVYKKLRKLHKLTASPYMVLAAINIYEAGGVAKADENIEKLETVYKGMKSEHFWLTGDEDRPFLAMLVSRDINYNAISTDISACYEACRKMAFSKEKVHMTAQIMALSDKSVQAKTAAINTSFAALKRARIPGSRSDLMPLTAVLGMIEESADAQAAAIREIYDYLKKQKGFKWYLGDTTRSMYSILAYALEHLDDDRTAMNSVISTTIANVIVTEILLIMIVSSNAASAARTSGSH